MKKIVVCLLPLLLLLFMVEAGTVRSFYDEGSKALYSFHDEPATWLTAYTTCVKEGGRLAMVTYENKAFFNTHYPKDYTRVFLGYNNWQNGLWRTIQDRSLSEAGYENWNDGEPNNAGGSQRCGAMYKDGALDDFDCDEKSPFICRINTFSEGYTYYESTKTYYKFHVKPATWLTAYTTCIEESGHLAIINNQKEADFFVRNFPPYQDKVFLGFNNWERDNSWFTIDGKPLREAGYEKWAPGEPNIGWSRLNRCGTMLKSGDFYAYHCDAMLRFICEKKSNSHAPGGEIKHNDGTGSTTEDLATIEDEMYSPTVEDQTEGTGSTVEDWATTGITDTSDTGTTGTDVWDSSTVADQTDDIVSETSSGTTDTDVWDSFTVTDQTDDTVSETGSGTTDTDVWDSSTVTDQTEGTGSAVEDWATTRITGTTDSGTTGTDVWDSSTDTYQTDGTGSTTRDSTTIEDEMYSPTVEDQTDDTVSETGSGTTDTDVWDSSTVTDQTGYSESTTESATGTDVWDRSMVRDQTDVDASRCEDNPNYVPFCKKVVRNKQCHHQKFKKMCCRSCSKAAKHT